MTGSASRNARFGAATPYGSDVLARGADAVLADDHLNADRDSDRPSSAVDAESQPTPANPYSRAGLSTRIFLRVAASGTHLTS